MNKAFYALLTNKNYNPSKEEIITAADYVITSLIEKSVTTKKAESSLVSTKKGGKKKKGKYTQKAGFTKLGRCYIIPLPNDNLKIILGRRKYVTKNFDINPASKTLIYNVANNPVTKNKCIAVARYEDRRLKFIKKEQRKTKKVYK